MPAANALFEMFQSTHHRLALDSLRRMVPNVKNYYLNEHPNGLSSALLFIDSDSCTKFTMK
jgi:hypothetical protein